MIPKLPKLRVATVARVSTLTAIASILLAIPVAAAQSPNARAKSQQVFPRVSVSGSYLAARHAGIERDAAAAALYYRAALRGDPRNTELLNRAFLALLTNGEFEDAVRLAERVVQTDKGDRDRPAGAWRPCHQAEAVHHRAPAACSVDARADHRSGGDVAVGLDQYRPEREQGRDRTRSTSSPGRNGTLCSRTCMPA